jgi:hypothetical protein
MISWVVDDRTFSRDPTFHGVSCIIRLPQHALKIEWCISLSVRVVSTTKFRGLLFNLPCYIPLNGRTDAECRFGRRSIVAGPVVIKMWLCCSLDEAYIYLHFGLEVSNWQSWLFIQSPNFLFNLEWTRIIIVVIIDTVIRCWCRTPGYESDNLLRFTAFVSRCLSRTKQVSLRFLFTTD